jgi:response regulator RpfG family c-di-GMP phosphodiesterase
MNHTKILLVDDQPISLLYLKKTLSRLEDMEITTCGNAQEALNLFPLKPWDLIVADYQMPGMNGLDFIRQFRQIKGGEETPILMVTASTDPIVDFLQKPADASEIIARARNLISLHKATVSLKNHNQELKKGVQEMTKVLAEREQESLIVLARAAESRDPQTGSHLLRMASYSKIIALALGLSEDEAEEIYLAAPMHDVGKIGIPDRILLKGGKLTPEEWLEMKRHTNYGYDILRSSVTPILKLGGVIALNHHEAWNGSGYPNGKKGHEIPLCARIVAVADVFDALMSPRPYKEAWSLDEALVELTNIAGVRLDSECVNAFMQSIDTVKQIMNDYVDV